MDAIFHAGPRKLWYLQYCMLHWQVTRKGVPVLWRDISVIMPFFFMCKPKVVDIFFLSLYLLSQLKCTEKLGLLFSRNVSSSLTFNILTFFFHLRLKLITLALKCISDLLNQFLYQKCSRALEIVISGRVPYRYHSHAWRSKCAEKY